MDTRRRAPRAVALALFVVAALVTPADASPSGTLTLQGSRSGWVDVTFARDVTLDLARPQHTGGGRFIGLYVEAIDRPPAARAAAGRHLGAVVFRDLQVPGEPTVVLGFEATPSTTLKPGRYRVRFLTDGQGTLRLPIRGAPSMSLHPRGPVSVAAASRADVLSSPFMGRNVQPLRVTGARNVTISSLVFGNFRAFVGQMGSCVRAPGTECGSTGRGADGPYTGYVLSPLQESAMSFTFGYQPGALAPGRYEAEQGVLNATTLQFARAAALTVSLD